MEGRRSRAKPVPGMAVGSSIGRIAAAFLIAANLVYMVASLVYVTNVITHVSQAIDLSDPAAVLLVLLTDGQWFMAVGDLLVVVGAGLLSAALASLLVGLLPRQRKAPRDAFLPGLAAFACLVAWALAAAISFGRPRGSGLNAAAATGGQGVAAALLLVASLLYLSVAVRIGTWSGKRRIVPYVWPAYAAGDAVG